MTDFLEALLDLPQEEEEMGLELRLPSEGRRPDAAVERVQVRGPGRAAEGTPLSPSPVQRTALVQGEAPVRAGVSPHGELRVKQTEQAVFGAVQPQGKAEAPEQQAAPAVRQADGYVGLPDRTVESVRDALARGAALTLLRQEGAGGYGQTDGPRYARVFAAGSGTGGAAVLERRLAQNGAQPAAVRRMDGGQVTVEAGTDLEELDRKIRRDARRYDGALTL